MYNVFGNVCPCCKKVDHTINNLMLMSCSTKQTVTYVKVKLKLKAWFVPLTELWYYHLF